MTPRPIVRPLDGLWSPGVLVWILLAGEGLACVLALAQNLEDRLVYFGLASLLVQWTSVLALAFVYLLRAPLSRLRAHHLAYVALAALVLSAIIVSGLAWAGLRSYWPMDHEGWTSFCLRLIAIAIVVGLFGLSAFHNHWNARQSAVRTKQLQLESLQARIQPHFLFNTLNTGAALVRARPDEAERLLLDLSDLFRAALAGPGDVTLREELTLTRRYLEIESLRLGDRLQLDWDVPETVPDVLLPGLSIQPLAENAVRHGVEPSVNGCLVTISVQQDAKEIRVVIANDLPSGSRASAKGFHVGLASARERLEAMGQGRASLHVETVDGRYLATVTLSRLPVTQT